jgi:hypothetical protein
MAQRVVIVRNIGVSLLERDRTRVRARYREA